MSYHCCLVVDINVLQKQNIFFSRMNRPSDDSPRRIIPVQFWELLNTWKHFFSEIKRKKKHIYIYIFFVFFLNFVKFKKKNFVTKFDHEKGPN